MGGASREVAIARLLSLERTARGPRCATSTAASTVYAKMACVNATLVSVGPHATSQWAARTTAMDTACATLVFVPVAQDSQVSLATKPSTVPTIVICMESA